MAEAATNDLTESLIDKSSPVDDTLVTVHAPSDLSEGYTFDAVINDTTFTVTVPPGGVKEGQSIQVPFTAPSSNTASPLFVVPEGKWRDGLFDCFKHGFCEPMCCLSFWCGGIGQGQIMQRMKLNW
eukprot:CAMPEP_0172495836 /NCGR_PEP_ID=MMETSP1066-20121228/78624_1 /TAXON_ID=671091 /ORGANISM="Coscinodiscus wailesii, Strain CCMP2513" /LENGTH=125 /DNA_ID=CAMNT_0013267797 /DNA_START=52 /DNA_END=426 /DNA_ORIENTATION=+